MLGAVKMKIFFTESFLSARKIYAHKEPLDPVLWREPLVSFFKIMLNLIKWLKAGRCLPPFSLPISSNRQVSVETRRAMDYEKRRRGDLKLKKG